MLWLRCANAPSSLPRGIPLLQHTDLVSGEDLPPGPGSATSPWIRGLPQAPMQEALNCITPIGCLPTRRLQLRPCSAYKFID